MRRALLPARHGRSIWDGQLASVLSPNYLGTCGKVLRGKVEERGGVDAIASSTTGDKEIVGNPFLPRGLERDGPDLCDVLPGRY